MENKPQITISLELAQSLVNYLQTKPYGEVADLIRQLIASAQSPPTEDTAES